MLRLAIFYIAALWLAHAVVGAVLSLPVVALGRRRVSWRSWEMLGFIVPFLAWVGSLYLFPQPSVAAGWDILAEPLLFALAIPIAALLRVWIGKSLNETRCAVGLLAALCIVAALVYFLTPNLDVPQPDPLAGWHKWGVDTGYHLDKAIMDDYQAYIETLPSPEKEIAKFPYGQLFCEDGTGQHAVVLDIPHDGKHWAHVLIYDKSNRRIKVIKYWWGRYSC